ncbi:MAG: hypothetical protein ACRCSG_00030 [Cellulosilyticaceae bacterium]
MALFDKVFFADNKEKVRHLQEISKQIILLFDQYQYAWNQLSAKSTAKNKIPKLRKQFKYSTIEECLEEMTEAKKILDTEVEELSGALELKKILERDDYGIEEIEDELIDNIFEGVEVDTIYDIVIVRVLAYKKFIKKAEIVAEVVEVFTEKLDEIIMKEEIELEKMDHEIKQFHKGKVHTVKKNAMGLLEKEIIDINKRSKLQKNQLTEEGKGYIENKTTAIVNCKKAYLDKLEQYIKKNIERLKSNLKTIENKIIYNEGKEYFQLDNPKTKEIFEKLKNTEEIDNYFKVLKGNIDANNEEQVEYVYYENEKTGHIKIGSDESVQEHWYSKKSGKIVKEEKIYTLKRLQRGMESIENELEMLEHNINLNEEIDELIMKAVNREIDMEGIQRIQDMGLANIESNQELYGEYLAENLINIAIAIFLNAAISFYNEMNDNEKLNKGIEEMYNMLGTLTRIMRNDILAISSLTQSIVDGIVKLSENHLLVVETNKTNKTNVRVLKVIK